MESYKLSFCKINKLDVDTAEFIVNDGVEFDLPFVEEYHQWIQQNLIAPSFILVNKKNSYTYTFEAQRKIGTIAEIKALAFVTYTPISEFTTQALSELPRETSWNAAFFSDRESALTWLSEQRAASA